MRKSVILEGMSISCPASTTEPSARRLRSRVTNRPFSRISRNTAVGRRVADLALGFIRALGNPDDVTLLADCVAAAELKVIAEQARARALRDRTVDADAICRLEGAASRAVRRLGIERREPLVAVRAGQPALQAPARDATGSHPPATAGP
jgi:hypothetical protein